MSVVRHRGLARMRVARHRRDPELGVVRHRRDPEGRVVRERDAAGVVGFAGVYAAVRSRLWAGAGSVSAVDGLGGRVLSRLSRAQPVWRVQQRLS